jgi:hypothetical protein
MARRNLGRSLLAASLLAGSVLAGVLAVPAPPAGADGSGASLYQITLSEKSGFSPGVVDVRVGDYIAFILDTRYSASDNHSVTWDDTTPCPDGNGGTMPCWPELRFNDPNQKCMVRNYVLPNTRCILVHIAGAFRYHDRLSAESNGPDFQGLVRVADTSPPTTAPPTTTTTRAPTTTSTEPVTTTTVWWDSTTTTTAAGAIHPLLLANPAPTTTTTTGPPAAAAVAATDKGGAGSPAAPAGKDRSRAGSSTTTTTTTPPSTAPLLDAAALTPAPPAPVTLPDTVSTANAADSDLSGSVLGLLNHEKPADDYAGLMLAAALAAVGLFLVAIAAWRFYHRSSRYFPA